MRRTACMRTALVIGALLAASAVLATGCTIVRERIGDPLPSRDRLDLRVGGTTLRDALRQLGAPDRIVPIGDRLRLAYARRRRDARELRIDYQLQLLGVTDVDGEDVVLWLDFDADDRLAAVVWPPRP